MYTIFFYYNMSLNSSFIRTRIDPDLKSSVEKILEKLGISTGNAINAFFRQIEIHRGIPFELKLNDEYFENKLEKNDTPKNYTKIKDKEHLKSLIGLE